MNTDKIKKALTIIQEAIDETPDVTLTLKLTRREAELLRRICVTNMSVPLTVVRALPSYFALDTFEAREEMCDLLNKIHRGLP